MSDLEIRTLGPGDLEQARGVVSRGMLDNPGHICIFGEDAEYRLRRLERVFGVMFPWLQSQGEILGAWREGRVVGVVGMPPLGACFPSPTRNARMSLALLPGVRLREIRRGPVWLMEWKRRDPRERHQHVGPVAVDADLQRQGIGSRMMEAFCARMDDAGMLAHLETDKEENVRFYERFGFETTEKIAVFGVPNWFMHRRPRAG